MKRTLATLSVALLVLGSAACSADDGPRPGYGWGPGMMGGPGYGPGMMGGYGPGYGPGYGMGPGMMGGYGPGYGMGPGMMGGYGPGMGYGPGRALPDLSSEQQAKVNEIQGDFRRKQWDLAQKMHELMWAQPGDDGAARSNYDAVAALHKQMFENSLEARKRIEGVLTPQQREQLQRGPGRR